MPRKQKSAKAAFTFNNRAAGVLMHPTSLPGPHGSGDLGEHASRFVDFLAAARQTWWQMLPTNPPGGGDSPYSAFSAFAGHPGLISLHRLRDDGLLTDGDLKPVRSFKADKVNFAAVNKFRTQRLRRAFESFRDSRKKRLRREFETFCHREGFWLEDWALYGALKRAHNDKPWWQWTADVRSRRKPALRHAREHLAEQIQYESFVQFLFDRQWHALRRYCERNQVALVGDIPIFVAHDSADVWAHQKLFTLERDGRAKLVSGVPPDMFSKTGQRWGHPLYNWPRHKRTNYHWWIQRFKRAFDHFHGVRIDHFLGFNRCWAVPGKARTAQRGKWIKSPGRELFKTVTNELGRLEIIAEDLGLVVPEAVALREEFNYPGMYILQNAFGEGAYDRPHNHQRDGVVYPGIHDNHTTRGWFRHITRQAHARPRKPARPARAKPGRTPESDYAQMTPRDRVLAYTQSDGREIHWDLIKLAHQSPANTAIIPMQDLLGLDDRARMNVPGTAEGNWHWRMKPDAITPAITDRLRNLTLVTQR